jgi:hypothetical protein
MRKRIGEVSEGKAEAGKLENKFDRINRIDRK